VDLGGHRSVAGGFDQLGKIFSGKFRLRLSGLESNSY